MDIIPVFVEMRKQKIKESLKEATNTIKGILFNDEGKALFEETMIKADPDWKCNSSHIKEIAGWIVAGYLGKTQLSYRLLELDKSGVLEMQQIFTSINVLKSTIIAILFSGDFFATWNDVVKGCEGFLTYLKDRGKIE